MEEAFGVEDNWVVVDSWVVEDTSVVVEVAEAISRHGSRAALRAWSIVEGAVHLDNSIL